MGNCCSKSASDQNDDIPDQPIFVLHSANKIMPMQDQNTQGMSQAQGCRATEANGGAVREAALNIGHSAEGGAASVSDLPIESAHEEPNPLKRFLIKPLEYPAIKVPKVETEIDAAMKLYNDVLQDLKSLRNCRSGVIGWATYLIPGTVTLDTAVKHLASLLGHDQAFLQVWRDENDRLEILYSVQGITEFSAKLCVLRFSGIVKHINNLEDAEQKKDPIPRVTRVLERKTGEQGLDNLVRTVHDGSEQGHKYIQNYNDAMELVRNIPILWKTLLEERNETINEFLAAFEHLSDEPHDLSRQRKNIVWV